MYKTMQLCPECQNLLSEAYKLAAIPPRADAAPKIEACENCGTKTVLTLCTLRSKNGG